MVGRKQYLDRHDIEGAVRDLNAEPYALTDAATIAWDPANGNYFTVTLAGNRTLGVAANTPTEGEEYTFEIKQDATGSRTLTWPAIFDWGTTGAPTLTVTAAKVDIVKGMYRNGKMRAAIFAKGFA